MSLKSFLMPIGPHALEDVEEPMPSRPATLKDPGTPDQSAMVQDVRRIPRTRLSTPRTVEK